MLDAGIDPTRIPAHVGCVMDGNGRWAQRRGLPRTDGHAAGEEALFDTVEGALEVGIQWLTVYAFSTENWRRPADEVLQELIALSEHPQSGRGSGRAADLIGPVNVGGFHDRVGGLGRIDEVRQPAVLGVLVRRGSGDGNSRA